MKTERLADVIRVVRAGEQSVEPLHARLASRGKGGVQSPAPGAASAPRPLFAPELTEALLVSLEADPRVKKIVDEARQRAEREGLDAARKEIDELRGRYIASVARVEEAVGARPALLASEIVDLALVVAKELVGHEMTKYRERLVSLLTGAVASISAAEEIVVRMSREDREFLAGEKSQWANAKTRIVEDESLAPGACIIETSHHVVDASIEARIGAVREDLVRLLASEQQDVDPGGAEEEGVGP